MRQTCQGPPHHLSPSERVVYRELQYKDALEAIASEEDVYSNPAAYRMWRIARETLGWRTRQGSQSQC